MLSVVSFVPSLRAEDKAAVEPNVSSTAAASRPMGEPNALAEVLSETMFDPNGLAANNPTHTATDPNVLMVAETSSEKNELSAGQSPADLYDIADTENRDPADPNMFVEEEEDLFSPRFSTYLDITNLFEAIFTPELITDDGRVDYSTLRRKRQDLLRAMIKLNEINPAVLMALSTIDKQMTKAFWINTYNLCTLNLVIENYPIEPRPIMGIFYPDNSIMQISGNWRTKIFFDIQGLDYPLQEIEELFLLDRHHDPRIIFALSYASLGGAPLRNEPYTAEKLDQQLDNQVRQYLQNPKGMRIDKDKNILHLSNLFTMHNHRQMFLDSDYVDIKRFRDYPADEKAWLNFIWQYLSEEDRRYLENASPDVQFMKYDWHLNEAL